MTNPEQGPRHGIFGISAPPREAPAPVLPRPDVRPVPVPKPEKPPKTKKSLIQRLAGNLALRVILAGTALAGAGTGYAIYHEKSTDEVPAVHRAIDNLIGADTIPSVPSTFDNTKDKGVIGGSNIIPIDLQEIQSQFPQQIVAEGSKITFLNPFQLPDGTSASYVKSLSDRLMTEELQQQAQKDPQIKDHIDFVLPKGTVIYSPFDTHGSIGFGKTEFQQDATKAYSVGFTFYDKQKDTTYIISLYIPGRQGSFDPLLSMQRFDDNKYYRGTGWQDLPIINRGTLLLQTTQDNQLVRLSVGGYRGKKIGPEAALIDKTTFLVTPDFFTITNNAGAEKLLAIKK